MFSELKTPGLNYKNFHFGTNLDLILTSVICFVQRIPMILLSGNIPGVCNPFFMRKKHYSERAKAPDCAEGIVVVQGICPQ